MTFALSLSETGRSVRWTRLTRSSPSLDNLLNNPFLYLVQLRHPKDGRALYQVKRLFCANSV